MCRKQTQAYREMIKEAVDRCEDLDLLDLIYKLLATDQEKQDHERNTGTQANE